MTIENSREKFKKAVGILVDEKGRIKERLLVAYASQLCEIDQDHELPQSLIAAFDRFKDAISDAKMPYGYGEHAAKKLNYMSEDDASALAREIFNIFLKLQESELR